MTATSPGPNPPPLDCLLCSKNKLVVLRAQGLDLSPHSPMSLLQIKITETCGQRHPLSYGKAGLGTQSLNPISSVSQSLFQDTGKVERGKSAGCPFGKRLSTNPDFLFALGFLES